MNAHPWPDLDDDAVIEGTVVELVDQHLSAKGPHNVRTPHLSGPQVAGKGPQFCAPLPSREGIEYAVALAAHRVAFHAVRLPLYWARLAACAPLGLARLLGRLLAWTTDAEGRHVRATVARGDAAGGGGAVEASQFTRVQTVHRETIRERARLVATMAAAWVVLLAVLWVMAPRWWWAVAFVVVVPLTGWHGRREGQTVASRPVAASVAPVLSSDVILEALGSLGIAELNRGLKGDGLRFVAPIHRDGPGWRADLDLPPGVTAGDVIERRDRLASGLRRPEGAVWPEPDGTAHAGRLVLWVGDRALSSARPAPWPLTRSGRTNVFEPIPLGVDHRGRPVTVTLMFASGLVGSLPRMGKSNALRVILAGAALDPRVELHVVDGKGGADFAALTACAHFYASGDDDDTLAAILADLRAVQADMRARYAVLRDLPRDQAPEAKTTDELASQRRLGLHPVVVAIDETQAVFESSAGKEAAAIAEDLVRRGPAVGIMAWFATQRPDDKSIPTGVSSNAVLRLALKTMGHTPGELILGTGTYRDGLRPSAFSRSDVGVAWLVGEGDDPRIVRVHPLSAEDTYPVAARARALREAAGLLTGMAAGEDAADVHPLPTMAARVAAIWPTGQTRARFDELAPLLGETTETVSAALRGEGVRVVQVKRDDGTNRRGVTRDDVLDTAATQVAATDPGSTHATGQYAA